VNNITLQATFKSNELVRNCLESYVTTYLPDELDSDSSCDIEFTSIGETVNSFDGEDTTALVEFVVGSEEEKQVAEDFLADVIMDYMMDFSLTGKVNITEVTQ
jgi:hypothetical protein